MSKKVKVGELKPGDFFLLNDELNQVVCMEYSEYDCLTYSTKTRDIERCDKKLEVVPTEIEIKEPKKLTFGDLEVGTFFKFTDNDSLFSDGVMLKVQTPNQVVGYVALEKEKTVYHADFAVFFESEYLDDETEVEIWNKPFNTKHQ